MIRPAFPALFISAISVALCAQLILMPTRTFCGQYFSKDRPRLKLPVASNGRKTGCFGTSIPELSLNRRGQWVTYGEPEMNNQQARQYLNMVASRQTSRGYSPVLRLRITAQSPAKYFVSITHAAQDAGFNTIYLAVWKPQPYQ